MWSWVDDSSEVVDEQWKPGELFKVVVTLFFFVLSFFPFISKRQQDESLTRNREYERVENESPEDDNVNEQKSAF
jgi:hypothetical protein